jgi:hypothetical protein
MVLYVAIVAILNLGLGYALAVYMDRSAKQAAYGTDETFTSDEV